MSKLDLYKSQFFKSEKVHMNNAGLAPISLRAAEKVKYWAQRFYEEGFYTDNDYMNDVLHSRQSLAKLLNCSFDEVAFFQSTAGGVSQIAFGFGLKPGDQVVLWEQEYSSNLYPWQEACKRSGAELVFVSNLDNMQTPVDAIISHCNEKTKIVAISWVQFQTGARTDIQELVRQCHKQGIFVFVDVMQGLGLHQFDFKNWDVDAVAGGSHKWLTSPVGVGFLAFKKQHLSRFKPLVIGSSTYGTCDDPASLECIPKNDVTRFEAGSKQVLEITALGASCDLIHEIGREVIETETLRLASRLRLGLQAIGFKIHSPYSESNHQSAMVNFTCTDMENAKSALRAHPINFAIRGPGIRLSPHAFNTDEEIDLVIKVLSK